MKVKQKEPIKLKPDYVNQKTKQNKKPNRINKNIQKLVLESTNNINTLKNILR